VSEGDRVTVAVPLLTALGMALKCHALAQFRLHGNTQQMAPDERPLSD
jgi:hypothetical protein